MKPRWSKFLSIAVVFPFASIILNPYWIQIPVHMMQPTIVFMNINHHAVVLLPIVISEPSIVFPLTFWKHTYIFIIPTHLKRVSLP